MLGHSSSRSGDLVNHVERLIEDGALRPGDRIANKTELREQTGLSAAVISEGIRLLQARGRVTARPGPGGGLFVAEAHPLVRMGQSLLEVHNRPVTVADSIAVRDALEPLIAEEAARYRDEDDVADLRALLSRLHDEIRNPNEFLAVNWRLHRRIAKITPNEVLRTMYLSLAKIIEEEAAQASHPKGTSAHVRYKADRYELHQRYVEAIAAGDPIAARDAANNHSLLHGATTGWEMAPASR